MELDEKRLEVARAVLVVRVSPLVIEGQGLQQINVRVKNYGAQPIRRIRAALELREGRGRYELSRSVIGPGSSDELIHKVSPPLAVTGLPTWHVAEPSAAYIVTLCFVDSHGREWERVDNGEPKWLNPPKVSGTADLNDLREL